MTVVGATAGGVINGDTGAANTTTVGGNTVRTNLITQFNDLRSQLDKLADDSSFNGVNLLKGDTLKLVFNEINTSSISIVSQNANGINTSVLGIGTATASRVLEQHLARQPARRAVQRVDASCGRRRRPSVRTCRSCRIARSSPRR